MVARNKALGAFSLNTTVFGSGASTASILVLPRPSNSGRQRHSVLGSSQRFQLHTTSAEVIGAPFWNFTPSRSLKV
jgi:hypothetical protein